MPTPTLHIVWLLLPYLAGFVAALLPSQARALVLFSCLITAVVVCLALAATDQAGVPLTLLGPTGVTLQLDALAGWFVLLDAA